MVSSASFTDAPVTLALILSTTTLSIAASILDLKHLISLRITPHLFPYLQFSRLFTYQLAYTNSSELVFSTVVLYHLRILERVWGSRKYASFAACVYGINCVLVPLVLGTLVRALSWGAWNYLPGGAVGLVCAGVACFREEVPRLYRYKIEIAKGKGTRTSTRRDGVGVAEEQEGRSETPGITLSDKGTTYVLMAQLALSQFPYMLLPAGLGWMVGLAWRGDLLPWGMGRWRVPGWVVGESGFGKEGRRSREERERYEGLRRRLEEEGSSGDGMRMASGSAATIPEGGESRRRGLTGRVTEFLRGVF